MNTLPLWRQLEILFDTVPAPDGKSYSLTEVAAATGIALNTLSRLKTGRIEDPRLSTLLILMNFFHLSLDYFTCQTETACYQFLQQELHRRSTMPEIALRVREMSSDVMAELQRMVTYIDSLQEEDHAPLSTQAAED